MKKIYLGSLLSLLLLIVGSTNVWAQGTTISGTVKDEAGDPVPGANIVVKGTLAGTISDVQGKYNLVVKQALPFTIVISFQGFATQEIEVNDAAKTTFDISMAEESQLLSGVTVLVGPGDNQDFMKSPVTVEKLDIRAITQAATPDYFDALANLKGVQVSNGSMNFTAVNTRGFATISNTRFVQWVDGIDTQAPILNFPTGTIMGLNELDVESVDLIPGAASALYGPNAFNGIMIMKSKSPFDYQGLSAQLKVGSTNSQGGGNNMMTQYALRYAKAFNNKLAFKVGFSFMKATDWLGSDLKTDRINPESTVDLSGKQNFDGLNTYGDEFQIPVGLPTAPYVTRTGISEANLLDNRDAKTIKGDAAIHYKINDKIEAILAYRYGGGSSIYQGTEKYALRDFTQQFFRAEVKGTNFFVRGYMTKTDAGKSYNLSALGFQANEAFTPSATWAQDYALAMQGYVPSVPAGTPTAARTFADRNIPAPGSAAFNQVLNEVRANYFQKPTTALPYGGAGFIDDSRMYHVEFNYHFKQIDWADVQIGGNYRQFDLFSNGTVFNEAPNDGVNFQRIKINQYGIYAQVERNVTDALKLTGSVRYDKSDNFEGHTTPRFSAVYTINEKHNIRASYQTGFRNPDTQAQYIYFPSSGGTILGGTEANAGRYNVYGTGSYTNSSYKDYLSSGGSIDPLTGAKIGGDPTKLVDANLNYVKPERLSSIEVGYKGVFGDLVVDLNAYWTTYNDFLGESLVNIKMPTTHQGNAVPAGATYAAYTNATETVTSNGIGLGVYYNLPRDFTLTGSYSYATYAANETVDFYAGFNTPKNKFSVGVGNQKLVKNLGFNVNYRYQDAFFWQSSYGNWNVPKYGVLDAQVSYKLTSIKTIFKLGATNLGGGDYRTNFGAPFVGQTYYISLTFNEFLK